MHGDIRFFSYFDSAFQNILGMDQVSSPNEALLSPVQCAVKWPEPANVERDNTNGRLLRIVVIALENQTYFTSTGNPISNNTYAFDALDSKKPNIL